MNCKDCKTELTPDIKFLDTKLCIYCAVKSRYCVQCAELQPYSKMRAYMCAVCFREHPALAESHCRVCVDEKLGCGSRYFGVELETEVVENNPTHRFAGKAIVDQIRI